MWNSSPFKCRFTFDERLNESKRVLKLYPDVIPIICESADSSNKIHKSKFLINGKFTLGHFICVLRKKFHLHHEKAIFILINGKIVSVSRMLREIYDEYKDFDKFLYLKYSFENVFG